MRQKMTLGGWIEALEKTAAAAAAKTASTDELCTLEEGDIFRLAPTESEYDGLRGDVWYRFLRGPDDVGCYSFESVNDVWDYHEQPGGLLVQKLGDTMNENMNDARDPEEAIAARKRQEARARRGIELGYAEDEFYDFIDALPESQQLGAFKFGTDTADSYIAEGKIEEYDDDAYFSAALEMIADMDSDEFDKV